MKITLHYPEIGKDSVPIDFDVLPRVGEYIAFESTTYLVRKIVHCPTYPDEYSRVRVHLDAADDAA